MSRSVVEDIAGAFHQRYEALASDFDYRTRPKSAVGWDELPDNNRRLMLAVVDDLLARGVICPGIQATRREGSWRRSPNEADAYELDMAITDRCDLLLTTFHNDTPADYKRVIAELLPLLIARQTSEVATA